MRLWNLDRGASAADDGGSPEAMAGVIASIGADDFGAAALASLNAALDVDSWAVYEWHPSAPPSLHASGSYRIPDLTRSCFDAYRAGLYRRDRTVRELRERGELRPVMTHWRADEIGAQHRELIYARHGMRERIALVRPAADGGLLAVNLYRHQHRRGFADRDFDAVHGAAHWLVACVARHLALAQRRVAIPVANEPPPSGQAGHADATALAADRLGRHCLALTVRERQICERLLRGWTHDGIAADLGLSVPTVKTYRNRAFHRLGISHRSALHALVLGMEDPGPSGFACRPRG